MGAYEFFREGGDPPVGAPHELLAHAPESPQPKWAGTEGAPAMLVYAHPDDELLFAGGLMLAHPKWEWHLVCVTDPGREEEHERSRDLLIEYGVNIVDYLNLGFVDGFNPKPGFRSAFFRNIETAYQGRNPLITFTHGYRGEYGHHAHVWTHLATHLACDNVWDFLLPNPRVKQLRKTRVREVVCDKRKRDIFMEAYGDVARGLVRNTEWADAALDGPEFFTQGVVGL